MSMEPAAAVKVAHEKEQAKLRAMPELKEGRHLRKASLRRPG
jgi:hypothetical protein